MTSGSTAESSGDPAEADDGSEWRPADGTRLALYLVFLVIAGVYLTLAVQLAVDSRNGPGPGFFPRVAGALFAVCIVIDLIRLLLKRRRDGWERGIGKIPWASVGVLGCVLGYLLLVTPLGHLLASGLAVVAILIIVGKRPWWQLALAGAIAGFGTDYLFGELFGVRLPAGLLGIGFSSWI